MNLHLTSRGRTAAALAVLAAVLLTTSAWAGSILMKNGYIIQGRIVDRNGDAVILGVAQWQDGHRPPIRRVGFLRA